MASRFGKVTNLLFLCSRNRLRSPTAEQVFAAWPGVETASAGLAPDADEPATSERVEWADIIFVMERAHRTRLQKRFRKGLKSARVVCLDFVGLRLDRRPDDYGFMQPNWWPCWRRRWGRICSAEGMAEPALSRGCAGLN